jgi:hypothetical protein
MRTVRASQVRPGSREGVGWRLPEVRLAGHDRNEPGRAHVPTPATDRPDYGACSMATLRRMFIAWWWRAMRWMER